MKGNEGKKELRSFQAEAPSAHEGTHCFIGKDIILEESEDACLERITQQRSASFESQIAFSTDSLTQKQSL